MKKKKMMKDLSKIMKYLKDAGFIDESQKVSDMMMALDGVLSD